jgi:hypothetical protein
VLWKENVSIAAISSVVAPTRNSVPISAGIITTTGLTGIQTISCGMFTVFCAKTGGFLLICLTKAELLFIKMPCMRWGIISVSLPTLSVQPTELSSSIVLNMDSGKEPMISWSLKGTFSISNTYNLTFGLPQM